MSYSIDLIIPVYNEANFIGNILNQLQAYSFNSVTVIDAASTDTTREIVQAFPVNYIHCKQKGRAVQMNLGAKPSNSDYLLFLHADIILPANFHQLVLNELKQNSIQLANFRLSFNTNHWFLKLNSKFSHFNNQAFQFGDQGLLIVRELFIDLGGFNERLLFMEGNEIILRARKLHEFRKLPISIKASARKYEKYGVFKLQFSYILIYLLNALGYKQESILQRFRKVFEN